jgi:hypothetical protein
MTIMYSKSAIALATALGAFALAVPSVSHAENQAEWLQRQMQISDGYAPPPPVLPAPDGDRAGAPTVLRSASRAAHPAKPPPRPRRVLRPPAPVFEAPACQAACAVDEGPPAQVGCPECAAIAPTREIPIHGDGIGLAAVCALLAFAAFKVTNVVGTIQRS